MGRQLRRVPLDFDWPLNKVWEGFVNRHGRPCPEQDKTCFGGETAAQKWFYQVCRLIAMLGSEAVDGATPEMIAEHARRGRVYPHPYLEQWGEAPRQEVTFEERQQINAIQNPDEQRRALFAAHQKSRPLLPLTEEMAQLVTALAGKRPTSFGGDYEIYKKLRRVAKLPKTWGTCPVCKGEGIDPAVKEVYDAWKPTEPPVGEGWQLWETTSEGSPISIVYPTKEAFLAYLVGQGYSQKAAEIFCEDGSAPTMVVVQHAEGGATMYQNIESSELPR